MNRWLSMTIAAWMCVVVTGCNFFVNVTNDGPNPIVVTSDPLPVWPQMPFVILPGQAQKFGYTDATVSVIVNDNLAMKSGELDDIDIDRPNTTGAIELDWDGDTLTDTTQPPPP